MTTSGAQAEERCSSRLVFECLGGEHAAELFDVLSHPLVSQYLGCEPPQSVAELAVQFTRMAIGPAANSNDKAWINYAVRRKLDEKWIGRVQATIHDAWAEVAYLFGPSYWGHGYAAESLSWLHTRLQHDYGLTEFWATTACTNERSICLLLRSGYESTNCTDARTLSTHAPGDVAFRYMVHIDSSSA